MSKASKYYVIFTVLLIITFALTISGCGSKQSPTGGKEDINKLKVLAVFPVEFTEINEQKVELTFSKAIDKASFMKGYYIYPPVSNKKVDYDANIITIKFLEALQKDTNYYITLTTRIKDIRGNPLDNNQTLIFKHGTLQSNRVSGNIIYENAADNGLPVLVNLLSADSLLVLTKTVTGSSYAIDALNPLSYTLRTYIDKNLNGRYDANLEPFDEAILANQPIITHDLNMAYADTVQPVIKSIRTISNREYEINFNKVIKSYQKVMVENLEANESLNIFAINHELDKLTVLTSETDSTKYRFSVTDAVDRKGNKTALTPMTISGSNKPDKTAPVVISTVPRNGASVDNLQPILEITFSEIIPSSLFQASMNEVESKQPIPFRIIKSNHKTYQIKPEKQLVNYRTCVLTIENTTSDLSGNKLAKEFRLVFLPISRTASTPITDK